MVKDGDKVKVLYTGTLDDGSVFDASEMHGNEPLEFVVGSGQVIPGFDDGVRGMEVGEKKKVHIPCADAYGEWDENYVLRAPIDQIPNGQELADHVKETVILPVQGGQIQAVIASVENGIVTFDANHPMAGKDLNFELELVAVE